jgi:hypothetical protein
MTPRSVHSGQWNARRILGILLGLTLSGSTTAFAATSVFKLADDSTVVARGVVGSVQRYKDDTFLVFSITPRDVLKGSPAGDTSLLLVEERVFGTERPYFTSGDETLVFAVPLPPYSSYRQALPAGSYLRWTEIKDTTSDMAPLADPAVAAAVKAYLSFANDSNGRLRYLATVLASSVPRLRVRHCRAPTPPARAQSGSGDVGTGRSTRHRSDRRRTVRPSRAAPGGGNRRTGSCWPRAPRRAAARGVA